MARNAFFAALAAAGAVVTPVDTVTGREGMPAVVDEWQLTQLSLLPSDHELDEQKHVWTVPPGENGWQVEVERFLLELSHDEVTRLLVEAARSEAAA